MDYSNILTLLTSSLKGRHENFLTSYSFLALLGFLNERRGLSISLLKFDFKRKNGETLQEKVLNCCSDLRGCHMFAELVLIAKI